MQLAERVNRISISPTLAVMMEAEKYKARGIDVVDFGPGEPDFPTPEHIKRAAIRAIEQNYTKYTAAAGIAPLREAVCAWHAGQFGSSYEPAESIVTVGGKHAIFNAICALIQPGDEVLIPSPYWVSFPDIVKCAGGEPVFVPTDPSDGFRLRAEQVEQALTPHSKLLIVNSPNNPSGAVVPPAEFESVYELCRQRGLWLLSDECYSHFLYGQVKPYSIASVRESKPHVIIVGSLSKTFSMTGWRLGYALGPQPLVNAMVKLQSQSTSNPTSISQHAGLEALQGPMDSIATMLSEYVRRRTRIVEGLRAIPAITCNLPEGAFYVFPKVTRRGANGAPSEPVPDTMSLARELLERARVAVVPGEAFGVPGFLRLSYATSIERIEEGLGRLTRFFQAAESAR